MLADIAPTSQVRHLLMRMAEEAGARYIGIDFDPGADSRHVTVQASLTELPLQNASVGLLMCYHVLEHIPDDAAAMREIRRVLAPGGAALIQVPWRGDGVTDEDPGAPVEERIRRFGQADHVRYYGADFEDRLRRAGLSIARAEIGWLYDEWTQKAFGLAAEEPVWIATSGADPDLTLLRERCQENVRVSLKKTVDGLETRLTDVRAQRDRARRRVERLQARVKGLSAEHQLSDTARSRPSREAHFRSAIRRRLHEIRGRMLR